MKKLNWLLIYASPPGNCLCLKDHRWNDAERWKEMVSHELQSTPQGWCCKQNKHLANGWYSVHVYVFRPIMRTVVARIPMHVGHGLVQGSQWGHGRPANDRIWLNREVQSPSRVGELWLVRDQQPTIADSAWELAVTHIRRYPYLDIHFLVKTDDLSS